MEPIAVVGFSFKLPGDVLDETSFWNMMYTRANQMTEWPDTRITTDSFYDMDPQQRWALETSYHAFENAGIPLESLRGSQTAVYAASISNDYSSITHKDLSNIPRTAATGQAPSLLANRISWYYNLLGPSVFVDTACSGSMVGLDLACQALRQGEASTALIFGSSLLVSPESMLVLGNLGFLSPDGLSYSFDHRANGYARGEGIVALVVRPLSEALKNGDMIRAIIRSTGSNQDGRTPAISQPSAAAHERLIRRTYQKAGLDPGLTRYVEAHGTGTPIGDPIEIEGLGRVFRDYRSTKEPLYVGSIKANIGHLEGGSGIAGVIKTILILEKGIITPNALFEKPNPKIDTGFYNVSFPTKHINWPSNGLRRASVNSFGIGGTNSHAVIDDACHYMHSHGLKGNHHCQLSKEQSEDTEDTSILKSTTSFKLLVWTAADEKAMGRVLKGYGVYYQDAIGCNSKRLEGLAYTLAVRRTHLNWRSFAVIESTSSSTKLEDLPAMKPIRSASQPALAFVFTGQGAQYSGMGLELLRYPTFKQVLEDVDGIFASLGCQWSLFDELRNQDHIHLPEYSQPLCTALQIALVELLVSDFKLLPIAVVGHSSGEIAAAYTIGALSRRSACKVAYYRGQLAGKLKAQARHSGAMMAVNLAAEKVPSYLDTAAVSAVVESKRISVACINSPSNCTLSGPEEAIDTLKAQLDINGVFAQKLKTGVAYHSPAMQEIACEYLKRLGPLEPGINRTDISMVSSVSGLTIAPEFLSNPQYWVDNLVSPVRFSAAIQELNQVSNKPNANAKVVEDIVEIGPHSTLRRPIQDTLANVNVSDRRSQPRYHSVLHRSKHPGRTVLELLGHLFCHGHQVSIIAGNKQSKRSSFLTDCPQYPFDQSLRYWEESRLSRDSRLPGVPSEGVLGIRSPDWNPLQPRWRNVWTVEAFPWIKDHVVNNATIIPGTASLVMTIEAVKQHVPPDLKVSGFLIEEAEFLSPITINEELGKTETMLHLRPKQKSSSIWPLRFETQIFAYREDHWTECFTATVQVQVDETSTDFNVTKERQLWLKQVSSHAHNSIASCTKPIDSRRFYNFAGDIGLSYGESFQLLNDIRWDGHDSSVASISLTPGSHYGSGQPFHPTVLDAALQLSLVQISKGISKKTAAIVPRRLTNAWISPERWETRSVVVSSNLRVGPGKRTLESTTHILDDSGSPLCVLDNLIMTPVSGTAVSEDKGTSIPYGISWKPQLSTLTPGELDQLCHAEVVAKNDEVTVTQSYDMNAAALITCLRKVLKELSTEDLRHSPPHMQKWLSIVQGFNTNEYSHLEHEIVDIEAFLQKCEKDNPEWRLGIVVARNLRALITGQLNPVELFFRDDNITEQFYSHMFEQVFDNRIRKFLDLASHQRPGLRILEVGAGTGGMTREVLSILRDLEQQDGSLRFMDYTYTDISTGFFDKASIKFQDSEERMIFKAFDLERDAISQGFDLGAYDLVVAGSVLHATSDLTATMKNLRQLLKPNGNLLYFEMVPLLRPELNIMFGVLPGWWLSTEDWRVNSPLITEAQWDKLLRQTGFSGNDLVIRDYESDSCHIWSLMVSTAEDKVRTADIPDCPIVLVMNPKSNTQVALANIIQLTRKVTIIPLSAVRVARWTDLDVVISLLDIGASFISNISETDFYDMKLLVQKANRLLWVTTTTTKTEDHPWSNAMVGFFRTIRAESSQKHIVTLLVESEDNEVSETRCAEHISKVLRSVFDKESPEIEFLARGGLLNIGRLAKEISVDERINSLVLPRLRKEQWFPGPAVKLDIASPGILDSLQFIDDSAFHDRSLGPEEVEIEMKTWPMDYRDLLIAQGHLEGDNEFGLACAGEVTRLGAACHELQPGDRVVLVGTGTARSYPRGHVRAVAKIPDTMPFEDAVSSIGPAMTAYHSLIKLARIRKVDTILIHSAAGGIGQMAIWVAKTVGSRILTTAGSINERKLLMDEFGIPEDNIFYDQDSYFTQGVIRATEGKGVDVILNDSSSGYDLRANWECLAPYGRFVEIGRIDINSNVPLSASPLRQNTSFFNVDVRHILQTDIELTHELLSNIMDLLTQGVLKYPFPKHVFPVSDIESGFRHVQNARDWGQVVVTTQHDDLVEKLRCQSSTWEFDNEASYVVAGGHGGVGRSIVEWMIGKGAKYLIVLSRSGASSRAATEMVSRLRAKGVAIVTPQCDITSMAALTEVLEVCSRTMPPIKGCINAANALQDAIFDNMSYGQWNLTVRTKAASSWNLHQLLPDDLDFFVLVSSLAGVNGSSSQSNYGAGCAYQDALAQYRLSRGQRAISFDLGWMRTIGIVAESEMYLRLMESIRDYTPVEEEELFALLDIYCDPSLPALPPAQGQVLLGTQTKADASRPLSSTMRRVSGRGTQNSLDHSVQDVVALFQKAEDPSKRIDIVLQALRDKLARLLYVSADDIYLDKCLSDYGVDSLIAVEMVNWIIHDFRAVLAVFDIMGGKTIEAIASLIVERSRLDTENKPSS
ncbi:hypothetical protein F4776DRAFT_672631 [Hypoxylon sp. NC0597]|nr:hypothetical protein F4776DRAFT_672631 [Hypoxylon sp. NC0597]